MILPCKREATRGRLHVPGVKNKHVGKTSIITNYIKVPMTIAPTIGANLFMCQFFSQSELTRLKLEIWDTAGQEKYRSIMPMYYRKSHAAILVFDLTNYKSFEEMKLWVTELRKFISTRVLMVVVGNKSDLHEQRVIDKTEAQNYAMMINATYYETSVLLNSGIDVIFEHIATNLFKRETENIARANIANICLSSENAPKRKNKCCAI